MKRYLLLFALALVFGNGAWAGFITLDNPIQTGYPGDTLVFAGVLTDSGQATVFLNGAILNLSGDSFTVDFIDTVFNNVPISLDPGQSTVSIELFDVAVNNLFTDPPGLYGGTYTLFGGIDCGAQDVLDS